MCENEFSMPNHPEFTEEQIEHCNETGDFIPVLFEWYKFVGELGVIVTHIMPESPAFKKIPEINYHIVMGLLNRCCRLMLSNITLSHQGNFGETTSIIDRCIFESAIKLQWLCTNSTQEKFNQFLAHGLKTELELKKWIDDAVVKAGEVKEIETRMLKSINKHIETSGLDEVQIKKLTKLPDISAIMKQIGYDRLMYIVAQKIGSHHVHGTWPSLFLHYLEERDIESTDSELPKFQPRGHDCSMHLNQYWFISLIMLDTMSVYVGYTLHDKDANELKKQFEDTKNKILLAYPTSE